MSISIEQDLKEVLSKIDQKLDNITKEISEIRQKDLVELKVSVVRLEGEVKRVDEKIEGEIKRVDEKIDAKFDGLNKRLDTQEFINRGVLIGLIVAILGSFAKLFGLVGKP
jgi:predicted  nucleic acid-binding Zn-ribbon protein